MQEIRNIVCKEFELTNTQLDSSKRDRLFVDARKCYVTILHNHFNYGWTSLARDLNKTHASIIHLSKAHKDLYENEKYYKDLFDVCENVALTLRENEPQIDEVGVIRKKISALESELLRQRGYLKMIENKQYYK